MGSNDQARSKSAIAHLEPAYPPGAPGARLHGRWLLFARIAWFAVVAIVLGLFVASTPPYYAYLHTIVPAVSLQSGQLTASGVQALQSMGLSVDFYALYQIALNAVFLLGFMVVGAVLFWRKSDDLMALLTSFATVTFGLGFSNNVNQVQALSASWPLAGQLVIFSSILLSLFFYLFPSGRFVPTWSRWLMLGWLIHQAIFSFVPSSSLDQLPLLAVLDGLLFLFLLISLVAVQVYRYRRVSTPLQRQQTKWVVFGVAVAIMGFLGSMLLSAFLGSDIQPGTFFYFIQNTAIALFLLCIPISIGIAILRSRLWDIDILINRTLVYGLLTATLALVYWASVVGLQTGLRPIVGEGNDLAIVVSTLVIAAVFLPLRTRVQKFIDLRFYRRKYDAARTLDAFSRTARDEVDLDTLTGRLVEVVEETMQPTQIWLWLRPEQARKAER